jgi:hypothetical protein
VTVPSTRQATPGGLEITVEGSPAELAAFQRLLDSTGRFQVLHAGEVTRPVAGRLRQYLRLMFQTASPTTTAPEEGTLVP